MSNEDSPEPVQIELGQDRSYAISFRPRTHLPQILRSAGVHTERCVIVTDENVERLYKTSILAPLQDDGITPLIITLPPGETTKSFSNFQSVCDSALSWGIERSTALVAIGGGVVGDLGGFAAATLLRGLPLIQVPTTLIAQVDSAIGGKTGINHAVGKNLIGSFYQPRAVLVDTTFLQTLPEREWTSGLAEALKHGLIADEGLFSFIEARWEEIAARTPDTVDQMVRDAARVKANVVATDERESGLRVILNFGHTFAHAIERVSGYGTFTHGEAVAAGMRAALHLSRSKSNHLDAVRADNLVARIPVPAGLRDLTTTALMAAMQSDKKVRRSRLRFVLLNRIGEAYVTDDVEVSDVVAAWRHVQDVSG